MGVKKGSPRPKSNKQRAGVFKTPTAVHENEEDLEETLEVVAHYYHRGWSEWQIKRQLEQERGISVGQMTVHRYIEKLRKRWQKPVADERTAFVNRMTERIEVLIREAYMALELSKGKERTVTKEYIPPLKGRPPAEEGSEVPSELRRAAEKVADSVDGDCTIDHRMRKLKLHAKKVTEKERLPAVQYMAIIKDCFDMLNDLHGAYAPKEAKLTVGGDDGKKVLDWTVHANALPPARNIQEELDAIREQLSVEDAEVLDSKPLPQEPKKGKKK